MKYLIIILTISYFPAFVSIAHSEPDIDEIVNSLDRLYRSDDSYAEMSMHIVTEHWERTLTMEAWSSGTDRTFVRVLSPAREKGMATLRIGTEMWNYLPNTNSTVRVPPSMMAGSWMGSDITNNDIVREITYAEDYTYSFAGDSVLNEGDNIEDALYIMLVPKPGTAVVWSSIVCAVRASDAIPLREEYYDSQGDLIKTVIYSEVQEMGGRTIPGQMQVIPADNPDQSTTVTWSSVEFDQGVDGSIFTLRNLQSAGNL